MIVEEPRLRSTSQYPAGCQSAPLFDMLCYTESSLNDKATRVMQRVPALRIVMFACLAMTGSAAQAHARHTARVHSGEPELRSTSAFIFDETHSSVLYSRRADVSAPIASITKLMTALVVADAGLPLDEPIQLTTEDRIVGKGATSRLALGTTLTRGDLIHLALMSSENRAAHALGRNYPGGLPAFVVAMNAKARTIGMTSTRFVDPAGVSSDNVASAQDLSKLVMAASRNPTIREYSTDRGYSVAVGRRTLAFHNTNALVSNPTWNIIVQKTGYISEAGRCLVMQAVIQGRTVVIVLLNSVGKNTRVADARRVRKWMEAKLNLADPGDQA
jgi:D-alanyl-D-alanine endopeptidase (penicillin-binding protein 7)